jgi:hypothetical protein
MRHLLTIYFDESAAAGAPPEQVKEVAGAYQAVTEEMTAAGVLVAGDGIQPTSTARTVRVQNGEPSVADGPFAKTSEQLGGFYVVDVDDTKAAEEWAAKIPGAQWGSVEVRPVIDYEA